MKYLLSIFLSILYYYSTAQIPDKAIKSYIIAQNYALNYQYPEAIIELNKVLQNAPNYLDARLLLAEIYYNSKQLPLAITHFEQAQLLLKNTTPTVHQTKLYWLLADAYLKQKNYIKTIQNAQTYLNQSVRTDFGTQIAQKLIKVAQFSDDAIKHPVPFQPKNISSFVNSIYDEYFPVQTPDGNKLYFTRREKYQEDIYYSEKINGIWSEAKLLPSEINDATQNDGSPSISANGNLLFFTACNRPNVFGSCDVFYSYYNGKTWTNSTGINKPINTNYWDAQPCFSTDGKTMYFSSDRPNGKGGKDIYISYLDEQLRWSEPQNLGDSINTSFDEQTPFIHPDGQTLYFASNGHIGMGLNDLFISKKINGNWTKPTNLGYPINTENDEMGLFVTLDGSKAFFASNRQDGKGKLDIYEFDLPKTLQPQATTYVKVKVINATTKSALFSSYAIQDINNNEIITKGSTNAEGYFIACLNANRNYSLTIQKENFLLHTENFSFKEGTIFQPYELEVALQPLEKNSHIILKNIFYDVNSADLKENSFSELDKLYTFLTINKELKVEISGHTDNSGDKNYNQQLSQKRAQNVVNYLVQKGIVATRLIAKGYGDTQPIVNNTTLENKAINRRTELRILE